MGKPLGKVICIGLDNFGRDLVKHFDEQNPGLLITRAITLSSINSLPKGARQLDLWAKFANLERDYFELKFSSQSAGKEELKLFYDQYIYLLDNDAKVAIFAPLGGEKTDDFVSLIEVLSTKKNNHPSFDFFVCVTMPFKFQGRKYLKSAINALNKLRSICAEEEVFVIDQQAYLKKSFDNDTTLTEAFYISADLIAKQISKKYSLPPIKVADTHKGKRKRSAKRKTPIWNSSSPIPKVTNPKRTARKDVTPEKSNVAENSFVAKTKSIFGQFIQKVVKTFVIMATLAAVLIIGAPFVQMTDKQLHAALTQPNALVSISGNDIQLRSCLCDRTLRPDEIPDNFKSLLIATEDKRFYTHSGVDLRSIARAVLSLGRKGGGSTIEMQLVKNSIAQPKRDIYRKVREFIFAYRLNRIFSKDDILRLYASRVNFGNVGAIEINGLRSAANFYFGKKPEDLNVQQSAMLVAMLKSPVAYHPIRKWQNNLARSKVVIALAAQNNSISQKEAQKLSKYRPKTAGIIPFRDRFFEDSIKREASKLNFKNGTYRLVLTVDPIAQMQALNVTTREVRNGASKNVTRAGLVSLDATGAIKAMVGGQNYLKNSYNLVTQANRQGASTFKIVTYLAALQQGYNQDTILIDDRKVLKNYKPKNYDGHYAGKISIADCFAKSKNVCTYYAAEQLVGFDKLSKVAYDLGLTDAGVAGESIVLGAAETTLLKNTTAFSIIKNDGILREPYLIRYAMNEYGSPIYTHEVKEERILSSDVSHKMVNLLDKVVSPEGTANVALLKNHKTYGKTGTSQEYRDAWFIGFTDHAITTGIWVGPEDDRKMRGVSGGSIPAQIFKRFNENLYERYAECASQFSPSSTGYDRDINC